MLVCVGGGGLSSQSGSSCAAQHANLISRLTCLHVFSLQHVAFVSNLPV